MHPGVVNTKATLDFVKAKIAAGAQPWTAAYNAAKADTYGSLSYADHPPSDTSGNVDCGSFSSPDIHCHDQRNDATAAYTDALLWYFSGNQAYATQGIKILNDWASSLASMTDVNNVVQAGWVGGLYAQAGEIFANTPGSGWTSSQITAFKNMLTNIVVPLNQYGQAGQNGNHETQNANAMIQLGVFLDNQTVYNTGISLWNGRITNYIYMTSDGSEPNTPTNCTSSNWWCTNEGSAASIATPVGCCSKTGGYNSAGSGWCSPATTGFPTACDPWGYWGQAATSVNHTNLVNGIVQEICRDFEHSTEGINSLVEGAETARIQGNPGLFTSNAARLSAAMELLAQYLNQAGANSTKSTITGPSWLCGGTLTMLGGSTSSPIPGWEIGYNEFVNREGLAMPNTLALINANRPMGYDGTRQSAWETLTHAGVGTACTPLTQQQACGSQTCGTAGDGCGGTLSCGTCGSGQTCNGTTCVPTCTPATCTSLGDNCGTPSDGCGGTLSCGTCTAPQVCGIGTAYHCGTDTAAPTVPTGLNATNVTGTTVTFDWTPSTDDVSVTGYNVYRNGTQVGTSTSTAYTDSGLTASTAYAYTVSAYDSAGLTSAQSTALNVTTGPASGCTVSSNTFSAGVGLITYTDPASETNPTIKFTLPSGVTYTTNGCHFSHQTAPGCTGVSCTTSGQTITYNFTGTLSPNTALTVYYTTSSSSEAPATNVIVDGNTCH
jgi:chitodextrinase